MILCLAACLLVAGCSRADKAARPAAKVPTVCTTFYAPTYFARRIAGARADVQCLLPAGEDPIFWIPSSKDIERYQKADLVILNGASFEKWVEKVSLSPSRTVDTDRPLAGTLLNYTNVVTHSHGAMGVHSHVGTDGHTWLDPLDAKIQADEIRKALTRLIPAAAGPFQADYNKLAADLDALDAALGKVSADMAGRPILASHESYNYVARRYKWKIKSLVLDPHVVPDAAAMAHIREILKNFPAKVILWETEPVSPIAERFKAELGLTSVVFNPCENRPPAGQDYMTVMKANIARLAAAVK